MKLTLCIGPTICSGPYRVHSERFTSHFDHHERGWCSSPYCSCICGGPLDRCSNDLHCSLHPLRDCDPRLDCGSHPLWHVHLGHDIWTTSQLRTEPIASCKRVFWIK